MLEFQNIYNLINNEKLFLLEDITQPFIDDIELANYNLLNEKLIRIGVSQSEQEIKKILIKQLGQIKDAISGGNIQTKYNDLKNLKNIQSTYYTNEDIVNNILVNAFNKHSSLSSNNDRQVLSGICTDLNQEIDTYTKKYQETILNNITTRQYNYFVCPQSYIYYTDSLKADVKTGNSLSELLSGAITNSSTTLTSDYNAIANLIANTSNLSSYVFISFVGNDSSDKMDTYISTFKQNLSSLGSDVLNVNIDDNISFVDKFAPNNEKMEQIIDFVNKHQNKKFIINCKVGRSRSFTLSRLIESYIKNILEKPSKGCYIISPDIEYNYALICYFLLQVIYYLYNKKISAEKAIPKILNFIKFFPSDLTEKLNHFFNNIDDIAISVLNMDDKLEAYTDKIYNSLNAYISNDRMGREGHVNPAFVIPNSFKVTAGKIFKTNIYDNIHMDATTFNNIINYSADICKNSKKISISSYDIIITMASSTKNFFGEFLKSLDSSISHSIIISYGDTYNILKTTSLSSQCPSNLSIIKTDNPPLKDKSQASKESKRVSSFNDVSLFEQLLKSLKRSKKNIKILIMDDDIESGRSLLQLATEIRKCAISQKVNVSIDALTMFTSSLKGSKGIINEAATLSLVKNNIYHFNDFDVKFDSNLPSTTNFNSTPISRKDYNNFIFLYNQTDDVIEYAKDIKIPTSYITTLSGYNGYLIQHIYSCFELNYSNINKYIVTPDYYNEFLVPATKINWDDKKISDAVTPTLSASLQTLNTQKQTLTTYTEIPKKISEFKKVKAALTGITTGINKVLVLKIPKGRISTNLCDAEETTRLKEVLSVIQSGIKMCDNCIKRLESKSEIIGTYETEAKSTYNKQLPKINKAIEIIQKHYDKYIIYQAKTPSKNI